MNARRKLPERLSKLLRSQLEQAIFEANLGAAGTQIAKRYLIDRWAHIDIAIELDCDRSTISKHMPEIMARVEFAAEKLFDE